MSKSLVFMLLCFACCSLADAGQFYSSDSMDLTSGFYDKLRKKVLVGGEDAQPGQASYVARIQIKTPENSFQCTGTLVSQEWVLSAAHCFFDKNKLRSTSSIAINFENAPKPLVVEADQLFTHPDYSVSRPLYDLALIRLNRPIFDIDPVQIILPTATLPAQTPAQLFGYGHVIAHRRTEIIKNNVAVKLQTMFLPVIERETAIDWIAMKAVHGEEVFDQIRSENRTTPDYFGYFDVMRKDKKVDEMRTQLDVVLPTKGLIFVGSDENKTACHGDSGGPLVIYDPKQKYAPIQAGVLHSGYFGCGFRYSPNLYIDLRAHVDWIQSKVFIQRMNLRLDWNQLRPGFKGIDI